ncbi:MAG TPA: PAS domain S-box protein [Caldilineaceae bacterium]|nr:PAS domain S-box protein [Caldilineaceae bacterium]
MELRPLLDPGSHVCHFYQSEEERAGLLARVVEEALAQGRQIVLIADQQRQAQLLAYLPPHLDAAALQQSGQLRLVLGQSLSDRLDGYLHNYFHAWLQDDQGDGPDPVAELAAQSGHYSGLAVISDSASLAPVTMTDEALFVYEALLHRLAADRRASVLCLYDRRSLDPALLKAALDLHPLVVAGHELYDNPQWAPPQVEQPEHARYVFEQRLARLAQRRQPQAAIDQEHELLRALVNDLPDYIYVKDVRSRFIFSNYAHRQVLGKRPLEEVIGKTDFDFFPRELAEQYYADEQALIASRQPLIAREEITVAADGRRQWVLTTKLPLIDPQGEIIGLYGISRDITELKETQLALEKRERQLSEAQRLTQIGSWEWDIQADVILWSRELYRIYGLDPGVGPLTYQDFLARLHPDDRPMVEQIIAQALRDARPFRFEHRIVRPDSAVRYIQAQGRVVVDDQGQSVVMYGTGQDITERKQLEAELLEVRRQLNEGREAERLHLARELHDMPIQELSAALMLLSDLQNHLTDPRLQATAASIQAGVQRANRMLRSLCDELRPPALEHFGLCAAIHSYVDHFRAAHPELEVALALPPDEEALPPWVALALYRICQQALTNVAQHAQASRVEVRLASGAEGLTLEVVDNGRGFRLPERWVELARRRHYGLLGAAERAESIGGHFAVLSAPGQGTTVRVHLPHGKLAE